MMTTTAGSIRAASWPAGGAFPQPGSAPPSADPVPGRRNYTNGAMPANPGRAEAGTARIPKPTSRPRAPGQAKPHDGHLPGDPFRAHVCRNWSANPISRSRRCRGEKETMNTTDTTAGRGLDALRAAIAAQVFMPDEAGYDRYAGDLLFPIQRAAKVLHAWRAWTDTVPDEVTALGRLLRPPPLPELPEALRGRAFINFEAACLADAGTGAELIGPLRRLGPGRAGARPDARAAEGQRHLQRRHARGPRLVRVPEYARHHPPRAGARLPPLARAADVRLPSPSLTVPRPAGGEGVGQHPVMPPTRRQEEFTAVRGSQAWLARWRVRAARGRGPTPRLWRGGGRRAWRTGCACGS